MFELAEDPGRAELAPAARSLGRAVAELQSAADSHDRELARARLPAAQGAFDRVSSFFDPPARAAARALAQRFSCPMHPDAIGRRGEPCAKCGMASSRRAPILPPGVSAAGPRASTVRAEVRTEQRLSPGQEVEGVLKLSTPAGRPVTPADLREVHTGKIHLLIVDASLADYHHEHPTEADAPGEYGFRFTPRRGVTGPSRTCSRWRRGSRSTRGPTCRRPQAWPAAWRRWPPAKPRPRACGIGSRRTATL